MTKSLKPSEDILLIKRKKLVKEAASWAVELESAVDDILVEYGLKPKPSVSYDNSSFVIEHIFARFNDVTHQLSDRYENRNSLILNDEYDVQDLLHSLLKLYFDDIRAEEHAPSFAGVNPRLDILLKKEQIVIEVKKTRSSLTFNKLRDDLIVDIVQYRTHPDCKMLYVFIYDPEKRIKNASGFKRDLSKTVPDLETRVFVIQ